MDYPEFRETIFKEVEGELPCDVTIRLLDVEKLNGALRYGILFTKDNAFFSPTIYLESFYKAYLKGEEISVLAKELVRCYQEETVPPPNCIKNLFDFEYAKYHIFAKMINREQNEKLLKDIPYYSFLDFAIIPYFELEPEETMQGTIQINHLFLKQWEITKEALLERAIQNTKDYKGVRFENIFEFLESHFSPEEEFAFEQTAGKMYVLTSENRRLGAILVCFPEVLKKIRDSLQEDYYLLPASIHEWVVVPLSCADDFVYLKWIVEQVNQTELMTEEVLSNNVYFYNSRLGNVVLC